MAYDRSKTVGRVAFLAHHETIRDLLNKGHRNISKLQSVKR